MTQVWLVDNEGGDVGKLGDWEYGGTFDGTPPLGERVQIIAGGAGHGSKFVRTIVAPGDQYGGSTGWRTIARQGNPMPIRKAGYDSCYCWMMRAPSGWPGDANIWMAGMEWHHTGATVAPHHIAVIAGQQIWVDVNGGEEKNWQRPVNQNFLAGEIVPDRWLFFGERYLHHPSAGAYGLYFLDPSKDKQVRTVIEKSNIPTNYIGFDDYALFGHYRNNTGSAVTKLDFDMLAEFTGPQALTEMKAFMLTVAGGGTIDPPPTPQPTPKVYASSILEKDIVRSNELWVVTVSDAEAAYVEFFVGSVLMSTKALQQGQAFLQLDLPEDTTKVGFRIYKADKTLLNNSVFNITVLPKIQGLLTSSWSEMKQSFAWTRYKRDSPNNARKVDDYWENGGVMPDIPDHYGKALVYEANARWRTPA